MADIWDQAAALSGERINESRLAIDVVSALRLASRELERAVELYGADGPMAALFTEQAARLADRTKPATSAREATRKAKADRARELEKQGLSRAQTALKMTAERNDPQRPPIDPGTVRRWLREPKS